MGSRSATGLTRHSVSYNDIVTWFELFISFVCFPQFLHVQLCELFQPFTNRCPECRVDNLEKSLDSVRTLNSRSV